MSSESNEGSEQSCPSSNSSATRSRFSGRRAVRIEPLALALMIRVAEHRLLLTDPSVPFTNNLVEQDGRMMKVKQKISRGFRSEHGASGFATILPVLSTARKQGWNMLETLMGDLVGLIGRLR